MLQVTTLSFLRTAPALSTSFSTLWKMVGLCQLSPAWEVGTECWLLSCKAHLSLFVCPTYPYSIPQCVPAAPTALGQATSTGTLPPAVPPLLACLLMKLALGDSDITRACISVQAHRQQTEE